MHVHVLIYSNSLTCRSMQELLVSFDPPDVTGIPPRDPLPTIPDPLTTAQDPLPSMPDPIPALDTITSSVASMLPLTIDSTQYGPGQSSPAVKLLSPVSFLSLPSDSRQPDHVLRSPSDFVSFSSPVSSGSGLLVAPPTIDNELVAISSSGASNESFPSALVEGVANEGTPLLEESLVHEEEWPVIEQVQSNDDLRKHASNIVSLVMDTALATVAAMREKEEEESTGDETNDDDEGEESVGGAKDSEDEVLVQSDGVMHSLINKLVVQQQEMK